MIWVINCNSNLCRIYQYDKQKPALNLLKEIEHPENKLRNSELASDKAGNYKAGNAHGAYAQASNPKEVVIERFYREIANELEHERSKNSYDQLIVITAPSTNGSLVNHFDKHVKPLISHSIQKDLLHLTDKELLTFLREHTKYPAH